LESSFWINPDHAAPHWTDVPNECTLTCPYWSGLARAAGCDLVLRALVEDLSVWRAARQELLDGPFSVEEMTATINRHERFIEAEAMADPTPTMYGTFAESVMGIRNSIPAQRERLEAMIAE
jgi:hypothetical protein